MFGTELINQQNRLHKLLGIADARSCCGCYACVDSCSREALQSHLTSAGYFRVKLDLARCIHCGKCAKVCPAGNFSYARTGGVSRVFAAWHPDENVRRRSASGGAAYALAAKVISAGGVAVGFAMNGAELEYRFAGTLAELAAQQGSKYTTADCSGMYGKIRELLQGNRLVFFCGLPCQAAALISFLGAEAENPNLLIADLVCTGATSRLPLLAIDRLYGGVEQISFRDKEHGHSTNYRFQFGTADGQRHEEHARSYYAQYSIMTPPTCRQCKFALPERRSDLTLADFWGEKRVSGSVANGISAVVVHSEKGEKFLAESGLECLAESWKEFLPANPRMIAANLPEPDRYGWHERIFLAGYRLTQFFVRGRRAFFFVVVSLARLMNKLKFRSRSAAQRQSAFVAAAATVLDEKVNRQ